jgi:hypothetical protein
LRGSVIGEFLATHDPAHGQENVPWGHPQQNDRHERTHLARKREAIRPPGMNILQQQARFAALRNEFNAERPHEGARQAVPRRPPLDLDPAVPWPA